MASKNIAVFGIYREPGGIERAVDALWNMGFRDTDIAFLVVENVGSKDLAHRKGTKAPEGIVAGASSGAILGGVLGWLAGLGALTVPGSGAFLAAGPVVAALAGVSAVGVAGGLIGGLIGIGIPEYEAKRFKGCVRQGGSLLSVHCDNRDWMNLAKTILEDTGAQDIASSDEAAADFARTDRPIPRTAAIDQDKLWEKRGV